MAPGEVPPAEAPAEPRPPVAADPAEQRPASAPEPAAPAHASAGGPAPTPQPAPDGPPDADAAWPDVTALPGDAPAASAPAASGAPETRPDRPAEPAAQQSAQPAAGGPEGGLSMVEVRRLWPDIVDATKMRRRLAWMILTQNAQVVGVDGRTLTVGFASQGARESFVGGGCDEILRQAAIDVVGVDWRIDAIVDPSAQGGSGQPVVTSASVPSTPSAPSAPQAAPADDRPAVDAPPDWVTGDAAPQAPAPPPEDSGPPRPPQDSAGLIAAREALERSRTAPSSDEPRVDHAALADAAADPDDPDADTQGLDSTALLQQTLGAKVIDEIRHT